MGGGAYKVSEGQLLNGAHPSVDGDCIWGTNYIGAFRGQGKIFRETRIYGNNLKIVNNRQPSKKIFNLQDIFLSCSKCSAAAAGSE
jgi:hypothetical protein